MIQLLNESDFELRECRWNEDVIIAVATAIWAIANFSPKKKISGVQRDSNPWPLRLWCSALPTELYVDSHIGSRLIYWAPVNSWQDERLNEIDFGLLPVCGFFLLLGHGQFNCEGKGSPRGMDCGWQLVRLRPKSLSEILPQCFTRYLQPIQFPFPGKVCEICPALRFKLRHMLRARN